MKARKYTEADLPAMIPIWNEIVEEGIGFHQLGTIPKGFRMKDGHYENTCPYYYEL